jgi:hypothetical protein
MPGRRSRGFGLPNATLVHFPPSPRGYLVGIHDGLLELCGGVAGRHEFRVFRFDIDDRVGGERNSDAFPQRNSLTPGTISLAAVLRAYARRSYAYETLKNRLTGRSHKVDHTAFARQAAFPNS